MDYEDISPKYMMELLPKVEQALWDMSESSKYQNVRRYIEMWHKDYWNGNFLDGENFEIVFTDEERTRINLAETLHRMPRGIVIRIAIDVGVDTPGFLPMIPEFKNILKDENQSAYQNFSRAIEGVVDDPDNAVALAASTLEGIVKTILEHEAFDVDPSKLKSLSKLVGAIVKELGFDDSNRPQEIATIATNLRSLANAIDDLRSDKSTAHGKSHKEYVVDDPLWAKLTVNTCSTLGLFLWEYFNKKYIPAKTKTEVTEYSLDDIPF